MSTATVQLFDPDSRIWTSDTLPLPICRNLDKIGQKYLGKIIAVTPVNRPTRFWFCRKNGVMPEDVTEEFSAGTWNRPSNFG